MFSQIQTGTRFQDQKASDAPLRNDQPAPVALFPAQARHGRCLNRRSCYLCLTFADPSHCNFPSSVGCAAKTFPMVFVSAGGQALFGQRYVIRVANVAVSDLPAKQKETPYKIRIETCVLTTLSYLQRSTSMGSAETFALQEIRTCGTALVCCWLKQLSYDYAPTLLIQISDSQHFPLCPCTLSLFLARSSPDSPESH